MVFLLKEADTERRRSIHHMSLTLSSKIIWIWIFLSLLSKYGIPIQDSFDFSFAKQKQKQKNFIVFSTSTKKKHKKKHFVNNKYIQCTLIFYPFNYPLFFSHKTLKLVFLNEKAARFWNFDEGFIFYLLVKLFETQI